MFPFRSPFALAWNARRRLNCYEASVHQELQKAKRVEQGLVYRFKYNDGVAVGQLAVFQDATDEHI